MFLQAFAAVAPASAQASDRRFALLIQNDSYPDDEPADTIGDDTSRLCTLLKTDGFEVELKRNVSRQELRSSVAAFVARTAPGSVALIYYKGIGIQVSRLNYLIPVDASIWSDDEVRREGTSLDQVMADLDKRGAGVKIAIVDAARSNPFERRFRMYAAGLAPLGAPKGSLVIFAEALNRVADPGKHSASPFTAELLRQLDEAADVETAFARTRERVAKASNGHQLPWVSSTLADPVRISRRHTTDLQPPPPAPAVRPPPIAPKPTPPPPQGTPQGKPPGGSADLSPAGQGKHPTSTQAGPTVQRPPVVPEPSDAQHGKPSEKPAGGSAEPAPSGRPSPTVPADQGKPPGRPAQGKAPQQSAGDMAGPPRSARPSPQAATPSSRPPSGTTGARPEPGTPPSKPSEKPLQQGAPRPKPAAAAERRPGSTFSDCQHCPEMSVLPAAAFKMGSGTTAFDRPVHSVTIRKPFAMAVSAVTREEWALCVKDGPCASRPTTMDSGHHPVVEVTWFDAKQYVAFLSRKTGSAYRLPTEAEWEYAARGGTTTVFAWGDTPGEGHANCTDCGNKSGRAQIEPARSYAKNGYGLFDMAGNVAEWLEDCWVLTYRDAPTDGSAPSVTSCKMRVVRGGSFETTSAYIKPTARFRYEADAKSRSIGFRVVRDLK